MNDVSLALQHPHASPVRHWLSEMTAAAPDLRQQYYQNLLAHADGAVDSDWLAQIVASWQAGQGALPDTLGLGEAAYNQLLQQRFPGYCLDSRSQTGKSIDFSRMLEKQDLEQYLRRYAVQVDQNSEWIIALIVAACLGSDHLWQDLGLWSRRELSALLNHYFPVLAALNNKDMKWKKFIYKQLCEAEGLYVCRAPSCEVCQDYPKCFGAEE